MVPSARRIDQSRTPGPSVAAAVMRDGTYGSDQAVRDAYLGQEANA